MYTAMASRLRDCLTCLNTLRAVRPPLNHRHIMSAPKKVKKKSAHKASTQLPTLHSHAAGIDIVAAQIPLKTSRKLI
jgi:hypothetical protein